MCVPVPYFTYILQNPDGRFYIGQTDDLALRLKRHNMDESFSTKNRGPWAIVWFKQFMSRAEAVTEERRLKALKSRKALTALVAQSVESRPSRD